ncbi:MAG: leucyl aminopeptidase family protein [Planctomycetota bacterium]|nr:MAG: leucyl aminopeptidase family protein [Planctomycetota bacterium]
MIQRCQITAAKGSAPVTILVAGATSAKAPKPIQEEAARLAKGEVSGVRSLLHDGHTWLLAAVKSQDWLVGGEDWRVLGGQLIQALRDSGHSAAVVEISADAAQVAALAEGMVLGDYRFDSCRSGKAAKRAKLTVRFPGHSKAVAQAVAQADAQNLARELCDMPGNLMNPRTFVARARKELAGLGLSISLIEGVAALAKARFPGLVQVGRAGSAPPALLTIRYTPKKGGKAAKVTKNAKKGPQLALVGKGITFDSGGISLKPGAGMWEMKGDMGGAAAVLGAMKLIAQQAPKVPVIGYCALAENMPDSLAQRPGDIYQARNGTYIHVDNTDAEGRLVLSDVLTYACEQGATHMADAATLTGACLVALGTNIAGLMANDEAWAQTVRASGQEVGEELWPLPLYGEYRKLIDHPHADINNTGGKFAGTITAGLFLKEFVSESVKWAHLDIAGPAMMGGPWRYFTKGNTGFAVRSFARLAHKLA